MSTSHRETNNTPHHIPQTFRISLPTEIPLLPFQSCGRPILDRGCDPIEGIFVGACAELGIWVSEGCRTDISATSTGVPAKSNWPGSSAMRSKDGWDLIRLRELTRGRRCVFAAGEDELDDDGDPVIGLSDVIGGVASGDEEAGENGWDMIES